MSILAFLRWLTALTLACFPLCTSVVLGDAIPRLAIVVGSHFSPLENYAADELKVILQRLYRVEVVDSVAGKGSDNIILLGQASTNPHLAQALGEHATDLSEQGLMLRSIGDEPRTLVVRGGSPVATLWAVYELGERLGVRYLCDRDVYPTPEPVAWKPLPKLDVVMEPNLRVRCWRLLNELAIGPLSWSLEENQRFLKQIAKMKFNRVQLFIWPAQPFVDYTFRGVSKEAGILFFGQKFPIDQGTIGQNKFGEMVEFTNPEFVNVKSPQEFQTRAVALARGIFQQARELGLETDLSLFPTEWPKEFSKAVPGSQPCQQVGNLTCGPGAALSVDDPVLHDIVFAVVRAHLETYPDIDILRLSLPEHAGWLSQAKLCYERLSQRYDLSEIGSFEALCDKARSRDTFPGGGARVERWMKESLATLYLLDRLVSERGLLKRPGGGPDVRLSLENVPEELFPIIAQQFPPESEVVSFIDYTASRQLQQVQVLRQPPIAGLDRLLTLTLGDDNVGILPQLAGGSLHKLLAEIRSHGWSGYATRFWNVGEQDPVTHFLARASWEAELTSQAAYADQVSAVCGAESVSSALQAFAAIEKVTQRLDQHGLGFAFPVPDMMQKHSGSGGLNAELSHDHVLYRQALADMQAASTKSRPEGRFYTDYFVGRLQFAVNYLDACDAFGKATAARQIGNLATATKEADLAEKAIRSGLESLLPTIRDHGELGTIAVLNEFCVKPIRQFERSLAELK